MHALHALLMPRGGEKMAKGRPSKNFRGGSNPHMGGSRGQSGQDNFSNVNRSRPKKSSGPGLIDILLGAKPRGKKSKR